jgi:hypothetical protein
LVELEDQIAFLSNNMHLGGYSDIMSIPYSRRKRIVDWKMEVLEKERQNNERIMQKIKSNRS